MITKIAVTGTKGKTTVVNLLALLFQRAAIFDTVLHVNTTGHFINGKRKSTLDDSVVRTGLVPSVAPGRYLHEIPLKDLAAKNILAVLETSLGCSSVSGMGYSRHEVGIFLNVFEDHLGSSSRLKTRQDIYKAKSFVFERIKNEGWAVLNSDDSYVMQAFAPVSTSPRKQSVLLFGLTSYDEVSQRYPGVPYVTIEDGWVMYYRSSGHKTKLVSVKKIVWTFNGLYKPSLYNLMAVTAGAIAVRGGKVLPGLGRILESLKLPDDGGRLTQFKAKSGALVIADYAHETRSLVEVGTLGHALKAENGKVIGVVRLAYDRTDALIADTGKAIAGVYDSLIVYDKIDGYWRMPKPVKGLLFTQEIGKVSTVLTEAIRKKNNNVSRIIREDMAICEAAKQAKEGDVVIVIVNDDIKQSLGFIKDFFKARLVQN